MIDGGEMEQDVATIESIDKALDLAVLSCPHSHPHLKLSSSCPALQILKKVAITSFQFGEGESLTILGYQPLGFFSFVSPGGSHDMVLSDYECSSVGVQKLSLSSARERFPLLQVTPNY